QIIDVSDPANPSGIGNYNTDGNAMGVWVVGDYAYVTDDARGLQIIDVSDPASPSLVDNYDTDGNAEDVYVAGNYAFVADGSEGLQIIDINPDNPPTLVSSFDTDGDCRCVYIHGDRAYVADGSEGFKIFDISNPVDLKRVSSFSTAGGQANDIFVSGNHAYVANGTLGVQIFDISDLANPKLVDTFAPTGGDARGIFVFGNYSYVADQDLGLIVYHVLNINRIGDNSYFSGKVGIGMEEPEAKLDVNGSIRATDIQVTGANQGSNYIRIGDVQLVWGIGYAENPGGYNITVTVNLPVTSYASHNVLITQRDPDATGYRKNLALKSLGTDSFSVWSPEGSGTTYYFDWLAIARWR
ncbi:hypothetical protein KA005_24870, partial [bacterium]|nr:hypothetical protein [bacterium]